MIRKTEFFFLSGTAGNIECALDLPETPPKAITILAHPHPLLGGTMDNKVIQILNRAFTSLGYAVARLNFRGVGNSQGDHAAGIGETDDMLLLIEYMEKKFPDLTLVLGGFSFGTFVVSKVHKKLTEQKHPPYRIILIAPTAGQWNPEQVPSDSIIIHGENDEIIPLSDVLSWARPQDLPVTVIPDATHLFNGKLHHLRQIVTNSFRI